MRSFVRSLVLALAALVLAACAPRGVVVTPQHPASPEAPSGRLAGPPAALRPGVVEASDPKPADTAEPAPEADPHEGHH